MCACWMHTCSLARVRVAFPLSPVSPYSPTVPNGCLGLRPSW
ncbi:unnamed protein product [Acanthoscelides obtectus]|uniref:Uncharacterized protein n=1 Tax=Acanthoscelides obtectus TaxID=200917 RepID=A0A9P0JWM8_ACAOB|nr:unnamed protein product [Acanthoscelides obtectus]CAK1625272.1 hypothetical protein AOBTE_LOCUS3075 [Acanthoscelides obtectus]